ncbi:scavenger receptor cysteine-rich type 1 protein M130-like [Scomber japonicus]|uniref:scavenger receptor cysteine-rich type 1 protein M130-like n=1 Tax=Scomber japonicus TaxID=13676 RepID=UPI002306B9A2|nr:scavenger receptor cysteine-rich type 1 protein M130-like [Scomber japonicus]
MDHLLMVLLLLCSSGLQAEDDHQPEPVRLVGGASRCAGTLEVKQREWRPVDYYYWTLKDADVICRYLDCGSAVSTRSRDEDSYKSVWWISSNCLLSGSALRDCVSSDSSFSIVEITCSDSVRLVNGTSLCSGRLEVKSEQSWSSMCEADFDQQDADVVCRELGCGSPSVLQGSLYGEVEAPMSTKEFQCGGNESALLDCRRSDSARRTCSPGKAVGLTCSEPVRLVGGASRCAGTLQVKYGEWRPVQHYEWTLKEADVICRYLDCGSAVSTRSRNEDSDISVWSISSDCLHSGSALMDCVSSDSSNHVVELTCSDSVRLVNGTSLCSGRLEVKSEQSWSSVCEADFDQQDAEVVCRELGCGAPSVLQGALYGEVEAPMWTKEFQCGGNESALLDCRRSNSTRRTCSPGKAVGLTCSEPFRLVGGASRCSGRLEVKQGQWRPVSDSDWTLKETVAICRYLNCGFAVSTRSRDEDSDTSVWSFRPDCLESGSALRDCVSSGSPFSIVDLTCSDFVRLVNGTSRCSGRLEVKSEQSWSSVCEADFDQQDAEVVCRELSCGAPSVLQGALYGEVEAPMWTKEFQCGGHESALLDCRRSDLARCTCSPGKAVGLTCSEPVRLVGGASRCAGTLEMKQGEWRPVEHYDWTLKEADVICRYLDCGSAVTTGSRDEDSDKSVLSISSDCLQSGSTLKDCVSSGYSSSIMEVTCSDSVRLVNGTSRCSGRLEVKSEQSWSSVCEADFDQQDADVVCRELGCEAPSVLQGALYGEVEAPMWTKEFQCGGNESALLDCRRSDSARRTCSPGKAVGLTCSEPVRLVGGASRCAGTLEVKYEEWKPVSSPGWTLKEAAITCRYLDCGSAVSTRSRYEDSNRSVWRISSYCVQSGSALSACVSSSDFSSSIVELTCSHLLLQPIISVSPTMDGVSGAQQQVFQVFWGSSFTISCSVQPQYPGGSFQLTFTSSNTTYNYTQPAVNHSADFLFPAADPAHQGNYSCVYGVYVFSHNFSSESRLLSLTVTDLIVFIIRLIVFPVCLPLVITAFFFILKVIRRQRSDPQENIELISYKLVVSRAEGEPAEEEEAQGSLTAVGEDLQKGLGWFAAECEAVGMRVNTSPYEVMVLCWNKVDCPFRGEVLQKGLGRFAVECEAVGMRVNTSPYEVMVLCWNKVDCPFREEFQNTLEGLHISAGLGTAWILQEELMSVAGEKEVWVSLLSLLRPSVEFCCWWNRRSLLVEPLLAAGGTAASCWWNRCWWNRRWLLVEPPLAAGGTAAGCWWNRRSLLVEPPLAAGGTAAGCWWNRRWLLVEPPLAAGGTAARCWWNRCWWNRCSLLMEPLLVEPLLVEPLLVEPPLAAGGTAAGCWWNRRSLLVEPLLVEPLLAADGTAAGGTAAGGTAAGGTAAGGTAAGSWWNRCWQLVEPLLLEPLLVEPPLAAGGTAARCWWNRCWLLVEPLLAAFTLSGANDTRESKERREN